VPGNAAANEWPAPKRKELIMRRTLLLQSVLGHLALLAEKHPRKAASPVARRAKLLAEASLRQRRSTSTTRQAA
jgi:hypothetical protein